METGSSLLQGSIEEVRGAISAFEEILHAMPNDRVALETLYEGYLMLNQSEQAAKFLVRLTNTMLEENDNAAVAELMPALRKHAQADADVAAILDQVETRLGTKPSSEKTEASSETPGESNTPAPKQELNANDITAELSMAWNIMQGQVFSEDEYSEVVHDLSELCSKQLNVPVSVLHVLADRTSANLEKIIQFVARDTNTPFIKLSRYDLDPTLLPYQLPEKTSHHRGALVFETMDGNAMVAILNPYDLQLLEHVTSELNCDCHFYITSAQEYDQALDKLFANSLNDHTATSLSADQDKAEAPERKSGLRLKSS